MALLSVNLRDGIILTAVITILLYVWEKNTAKITRNGEPLRKPPNTLPLVGNGIIFLQPRQKLFSWFHRCERLYGYETLHITVPSLPPGVIVNDPQNLDFIFRNEGVFEKANSSSSALGISSAMASSMSTASSGGCSARRDCGFFLQRL
ncbi:hypothetical protein NXS19_005061 [Fusarium pseudograminearum]|nr:hypothetical protein NXS19_005061 [Fusarium pseudograminearum]